jgi:hypothetical protein
LKREYALHPQPKETYDELFTLLRIDGERQFDGF